MGLEATESSSQPEEKSLFSRRGEERKTVQKEVKTATKKSREAYKDIIEVRLKSGDTRFALKESKTITDVPMKRSHSGWATVERADEPVFAKDLNSFYSRFDTHARVRHKQTSETT